MRLVEHDPGNRAEALAYVRWLIAEELAGVDEYSDGCFVVDAPDVWTCDKADEALDTLGAVSLRTDRPLGGLRTQLRCELPQWVTRELGLEGPDRPRMWLQPLASRKAREQAHGIIDNHLDQMLQIVRSAS